jgi:hypothetical protein
MPSRCLAASTASIVAFFVMIVHLSPSRESDGTRGALRPGQISGRDITGTA